MTNDARYHSITLQPDSEGKPGTYQLRFSTMPGMSVSITDLHEGDLDTLALLLRERRAQGGHISHYLPTVLISQLCKRCSFPMRPDAIAASDTCRETAASAVVMDNGNLMWRCPKHEGMQKPGVWGPIRFYAHKEVSP